MASIVSSRIPAPCACSFLFFDPSPTPAGFRREPAGLAPAPSVRSNELFIAFAMASPSRRRLDGRLLFMVSMPVNPAVMEARVVPPVRRISESGWPPIIVSTGQLAIESVYH
jgi:hypothetical protein